MRPVQHRVDRSCAGHNERQNGERHGHRAHKSERLFSVINMEIAREEEKACNCEIWALLPVLTFFCPPPHYLFLSFGPSRKEEAAASCALMTRGYSRRRGQSKLLLCGQNKFKDGLESLLLSPLSSVFGEQRKHRKLNLVLKAHTRARALSHVRVLSKIPTSKW